MGGEHSGRRPRRPPTSSSNAPISIPERIARTGQKLGLVSDARTRFERGVDPAFVETGPRSWRPGWRSSWPAARPREIVRAGAPPRPDKIGRLPAGAGRASWAASTCRRRGRRRYWQRLGFAVEARRAVADRGPDLAARRRRLGRHRRGGRPDRGLSTRSRRRRCRARPGVARPTATPEQLVERRVRRAAAARGLNEAVTWSFIAEAEADAVRRLAPGSSTIRSARR